MGVGYVSMRLTGVVARRCVREARRAWNGGRDPRPPSLYFVLWMLVAVPGLALGLRWSRPGWVRVVDPLA
jgi:hypothetical protein